MKPPLLSERRNAFTLVEMMVSMAILVLLLLVLVSITDATRRTWSYTTGKIEQFRDAREAFESVTRKMSQATLNTYWAYDDPNAPTKYRRQSELRFISGPAATLLAGVTGEGAITNTHAVFFQAPLGTVANASYSNLDNLLNTWGYFIEFNSDKPSWPPFVATMSVPPAEKYRFRLMELMEPSDTMTLYNYTNGKSVYPGANSYTGLDWFIVPMGLGSSRPARVLAENIVAMVLLPKLAAGDLGSVYNDASLAPGYLYSSTGTDTNGNLLATVSDSNLNPVNQLPPMVQVTMVAVDEASYNRYQLIQSGTTMPKLFNSNLFLTAADYSADLQTLQDQIKGNKINYRVFTSNVILKAAKWSRQQTN